MGFRRWQGGNSLPVHGTRGGVGNTDRGVATGQGEKSNVRGGDEGSTWEVETHVGSVDQSSWSVGDEHEGEVKHVQDDSGGSLSHRGYV